jgi:hypothetical protein
MQQLPEIPKTEYERCCQQWKSPWNSCNQAEGAYFERGLVHNQDKFSIVSCRESVQIFLIRSRVCARMCAHMHVQVLYQLHYPGHLYCSGTVMIHCKNNSTWEKNTTSTRQTVFTLMDQACLEASSLSSSSYKNKNNNQVQTKKHSMYNIFVFPP